MSNLDDLDVDLGGVASGVMNLQGDGHGLVGDELLVEGRATLVRP